MPASSPRNIACIVGARPNLVKIAPIMSELRTRTALVPRLIHTGQHYDKAMDRVFFEELAIAPPELNLGVGSASNVAQTARIMLALEPVFLAAPPDLVLVVGDVNSTLAAALAAAKLDIPVAHVEAGLRSGDRTMPEELNRLLTDRVADLLFATERSGVANLLSEGIPDGKIWLVGNVMIDTLMACLERAVPRHTTLVELGATADLLAAVTARAYGLVTLHRPSNVDDSATLRSLLEALVVVSRDLPLVLALHPRTQARIASDGLAVILQQSGVLVTPPLSYLRTLGLMRDAKLVITDSGGVQEETTALGVPCLTVRDNTERPVTVEDGTNTLVGSSPERLIGAVRGALANGGKRGRIPELWDGKAASRIADVVAAYLEARPRVEADLESRRPT